MGEESEGVPDLSNGPPSLLSSYFKSTVSGDSYASSMKGCGSV